MGSFDKEHNSSMQSAENRDGNQTAPMSSDESDAPKTSLRRLTKIIQNQEENEKLNPIGLALAAVILACCLICPMNSGRSDVEILAQFLKADSDQSSTAMLYFDYTMMAISGLILFVLALFTYLSFRN